MAYLFYVGASLVLLFAAWWLGCCHGGETVADQIRDEVDAWARQNGENGLTLTLRAIIKHWGGPR